MDLRWLYKEETVNTVSIFFSSVCKCNFYNARKIIFVFILSAVSIALYFCKNKKNKNLWNKELLDRVMWKSRVKTVLIIRRNKMFSKIPAFYSKKLRNHLLKSSLHMYLLFNILTWFMNLLYLKKHWWSNQRNWLVLKCVDWKQ